MVPTILKTFYQTALIRSRLWKSGLFAPHFDSKQKAHELILQRGVQWDPQRETKVFTIFHINNWEKILLEELQKIADTYHFHWDGASNFFDSTQAWEQFRDSLNQRLLQEFEQFYRDDVNLLVFIYASDFTISSSAIEKLKRPNTLVVNFCWDDLLYFKGNIKGQKVGVRELCQITDFNLTMSPEAISQYHELRAPCFFWKSLEEPVITTTENDDLPHRANEFYVLFIGSKYGLRGELIQKIQNAGIKVRCFGQGWGTSPLSFDDMVKEITRAPLTLGFANVGYTRTVTTIKGRDFEVPLWGGLYLTQFSQGLVEYYRDGIDLLTYRTAEECIEQIKFVQTNPEKSLQIRNSGKEQAEKFAQWGGRFRYLQQLINDVTNS